MKNKKDIYEILEEIAKRKTIDSILFVLKDKQTTQAQLIDFLIKNHDIKKSAAYQQVAKLKDKKILTIEHKKHNKYLVKIPREIRKLTLEIIKTIGKYRVEPTPTKIRKIYQGPKTAYIIETKRSYENYTPYVVLEPD